MDRYQSFTPLVGRSVRAYAVGMTTDVAPGLAQLLEQAEPGATFPLDPSWWGFGGLHGGLALALLTRALQARAEGRVLRQVSGQFRRPLRASLSLRVPQQVPGRTVSWLQGDALEEGRLAISAQAVFADAAPVAGGPAGPAMPSVPPPMDCAPFTGFARMAPFSVHTEIRPVGAARPFGGCAEPELGAWLRLIDDPLPPDAVRLVVLLDSLAPSHAAVLREPVPIPTVTFTVTPGAGLAQARSPWVLVRARTDLSRGDGWLLERLDAWAPDGAHLGSAEQLRVVAGGPRP